MTIPIKSPCEESAALATPTALQTCRGPWVLIVTILASSMAFIDGTAVNVALPALQAALHATVQDMQWVVEAYALLTLPSMPELRGLITPTPSDSTVLPSQPLSQSQPQAQLPSPITLPPIDLRKLPYKDPAREKARLDALAAGAGPYSGGGISAEEVAKRKADWERRVESRKRNTSWSAQREGKEKGELRRERKRRKRILSRSEAEQEREREWRELVEEVKKNRKRASEAEVDSMLRIESDN